MTTLYPDTSLEENLENLALKKIKSKIANQIKDSFFGLKNDINTRDNIERMINSMYPGSEIKIETNPNNPQELNINIGIQPSILEDLMPEATQRPEYLVLTHSAVCELESLGLAGQLGEVVVPTGDGFNFKCLSDGWVLVLKNKNNYNHLFQACSKLVGSWWRKNNNLDLRLKVIDVPGLVQGTIYHKDKRYEHYTNISEIMENYEFQG